MDAQDYPISQDYGYDPTYPLNNGFHKGVDYACPVGTPVIVNGVTIGLSGRSGAVTGPHLHVGRWVNGQSTNPERGGTTFFSAVVDSTGEDSVNGKYVRVNADGALWVYLHLSSINVSKGQVLKGGNMPVKTELSTARILSEGILGRDRDAVHAGRTDGDLLANHTNIDLTNEYIMRLWTSAEANSAAQARQAQQSFYQKYAALVGELESRPTKAQLDEVLKQLSDEAAKVAEAEKKLAEEQAKKTEDTQLLDETGSWLTKLFNRLFKKGK